MCVIPECSTPHRRRRAEAEVVGDNLQKQKKKREKNVCQKGGGATFFISVAAAAAVVVGVCLRSWRDTHTQTHFMRWIWRGRGRKKTMCVFLRIWTPRLSHNLLFGSLLSASRLERLSLSVYQRRILLFFFSERLRIEWVNSCDCHRQISPF